MFLTVKKFNKTSKGEMLISFDEEPHKIEYVLGVNVIILHLEEE